MILICAAENCEKIVHCKGFCRNHYQRYSKYGRLNKINGEKIKHPLYDTWNANRQRAGFVKEWLDDFYKFIKDVGEKPIDHRLTRIRLNEPFGPTNFKWVPLFKPLENETDKDRRIRQRVQKRVDNPDYYRALNYKYTFKLSIDQIEAKLKNQNYVCAICEQPETAVYKSTGVVKNLALDHDHKTNKMRDFLCFKCNSFLGKLENSILMDKFLNYLEKHK